MDDVRPWVKDDKAYCWQKCPRFLAPCRPTLAISEKAEDPACDIADPCLYWYMTEVKRLNEILRARGGITLPAEYKLAQRIEQLESQLEESTVRCTSCGQVIDDVNIVCTDCEGDDETSR